MSIIGSELLLASAAATGYQVERSLRFNSSDSAYLSRNFSSSATDLRRQTFSFWTKRVPGSTTNNWVFTGHNGSAAYETYISFSGDSFAFAFGGLSVTQCVANGFFRDPSAWYHFLVSVDTTQVTNTNRVKIYINGVQQTFSSATYPAQNATSQFGLNSGTQLIGSWTGNQYFYNGYLADIHFIDGQALTPSSFTEVSATTGQLIPKQYTGSFGTNGFWLDFSDNSAATATTLGKDRAGSNNWTPTNFSVAAGAGNDSLVDTPTSYGTDTGAGGEVRGNYCTLNPLDKGVDFTVSNGSLDGSRGASSWRGARATFGVTSGKWYFECIAGSADVMIGIADATTPITDYTFPGISAYSYGYYGQAGVKYNNGTGSAYGSGYTANDVIGVAFDADNGKVFFSKNGTWQASGNPAAGTNAAFTGLTGRVFFPMFAAFSSVVTNFGQRPFAYTAPSGFKALCDTNLPAPVVAKSNTAMDVALYTGTGSALTATSALGFSPDFVWIKGRSGATDHALYDAVRGATLDLVSNSTAAETTQTQGLTAFNSNGFSVGTLAKVNTSSATYAAWCWDAGSSTVTNTSGTISSQVRANTSAGFSIVTYTGTGSAGATVGHGGLVGLSNGMIIIKRRNTASTNWYIGHTSIGWTKSLFFTTDGAVVNTGVFNSTAPSSTVFTLGSEGDVNGSGGTFVAYCFAPVAGYSAFGTYTGNGSTDGPFVYTGHRAAFILFKRTDGTLTDWYIFDKSRLGYNAANYVLAPNNSDPEGTATVIDILSNGFKFRGTAAALNASGGTYIYAAFAENPFQYARAR